MKPIFTFVTLFFLFHTSIGFSHDSLESITQYIAANKKLKVLDQKARIDFAHRVLDSKISYEVLEPEINRFIKNGDLAFSALERAINRASKAQWRTERFLSLEATPDPVSYELKNLALKAFEQKIALSVYAYCIEPWHYLAMRQEHFSPRILDPIDNYDHMRHLSESVTIKSKASQKNNARTKAYALLVAAGQDIIKSQDLKPLEILLMARCIAENSVKFKLPKKHPIKACNESIKAPLLSPPNALFQKNGVCSNVAGITYNMAHALGFDAPLFLARHNFHVFLEAQIDGAWLHFHPLYSRKESSDFILFPKS